MLANSESSETLYTDKFSRYFILKDIRDNETEGCAFEDEHGDAEWALSASIKQRIMDWFHWFVKNHPDGAQPYDIAKKYLQLGEAGFRIVFLADPFNASRIVQLADARYAIDDALFERTSPSLEQYAKSKDIDIIEYLESAQMRDL